jgi:acyl-coenzyme A synthetase/AMP-(fatty) acid ligase/pimeloyl-ACP methyl ester carboxylesterase
LALEFPSDADWTRWGIDPAWHRSARIDLPNSASVDWSILDTGTGAMGTIVCVHGNPTWGYLWRDFLKTLSPDWRVIAIDQTGMGWSPRAEPHTLEQRSAELVAFCEQHTTGPLVIVAHDWGGPVALGAVSSLDVSAVILGNTAVAKPERTPMPPLIAMARRFVDLACRRTSLFVSGTAAMAAKEHRAALRAPYRTAARRAGVAEFVADIPIAPGDTSWMALQNSAANLANLRIPLLIVWGGRDPVFHDRFLSDLLTRAPHADVHRFPDAGHLVPLDEPMAEIASDWLDRVLGSSRTAATGTPADVPPASDRQFDNITSGLMRRSADDETAFSDASGSASWSALAQSSANIARVLVERGLAVGDRVAMLVPPGAELLSAAYGVWLAGGVLVVADSGLGAKGLRSVLRASRATWTFGTPKTLAAARALRWTPGAHLICTARFPGAINISKTSESADVVLPTIEAEFEAAIVHTSGSTGPAKPVRYSHLALSAQRDVIRDSFTMTPDRGFVTSFAPFVLLGPALGVPCVLPDIDVAKPVELDFERFAKVCESSPIDVAWLSPASARTIVTTAAGRTVKLRLVMLAGAPISPELASSIATVTGADVRSPWGMTEAMPLTDGVGAAACVELGTNTGRPLRGAEIVVLPLDRDNLEPLPTGEWGELAVSASWMFDGYEHQWSTEQRSEILLAGHRFHRTGDLGLFDESGNLHQLGRVQHALAIPGRNIPSVLIEQPLATELGRQVAAVGIGPRDTQVIAVVVQSIGKIRLADPELTSRVRSVSGFVIAAVLEGQLPVDIRHQSKVKRDVLASSVSMFLAGR